MTGAVVPQLVERRQFTGSRKHAAGWLAARCCAAVMQVGVDEGYAPLDRMRSDGAV